jgi:uncharacterized RDD family membrane protein YckC
MKQIQLVVMLSAAMGLPALAAGQTREVQRPPESAPSPSTEPRVEVDVYREHWGRPVLRIGQDYRLSAGAAAHEVVVIAGDATIEGLVDQNVVVVLGKAQISDTAIIDGSLIVVGGSAVASSGAVIRDDLVVVGGAFDAPAGFSPGGQHVVIGTTALGGRFEAVVPWITRGLLWGRPIVPDLRWVWTIVGFFFLVYLILSLILEQPVRACAEKLADKPLTTFAVGLLVLLLVGPVCVLLAVSVIGIAVVPFVLCALFVGWIVGKIGVARCIGMRVVREDSAESQLQASRSFVIGFAVICLLYMVPLLGFVAWGMIGVFGLGAATLAFIAAYREENPAPVPRGPGTPVPREPDAPAPPSPPATPDYYEGAPLPISEASSIERSSPAAPAAPAGVSDLASFPRAAFGERLAAFVLDVILVVIAQQLLDLTKRDSAIFLLLLGYHIGFWTWKSTTVGGIICQLRVVRVDGAPLRFADALVRGLSSIFSLAVLGLGALWILKDPERQAWHDKIAGTYVVKVPRNWPL